MWKGFSHVVLTAIWSKMRPNSGEIPSFFLSNAVEIPWLELAQNPCHVPAWKPYKTWINDMQSSWNLVFIWTKRKLPSICDGTWHGIVFPCESVSHFLQGLPPFSPYITWMTSCENFSSYFIHSPWTLDNGHWTCDIDDKYTQHPTFHSVNV